MVEMFSISSRGLGLGFGRCLFWDRGREVEGHPKVKDLMKFIPIAGIHLLVETNPNPPHPKP